MESSEVESALPEFLAESEEILARFSINLQRFEKGEWGQDILDELYRDMHTMKGSAQLFGFRQIGIAAHSMEACLDPIRRFKVKPQQPLLDALFKCVDLIEGLLKCVGKKDDPALIQKMDRVLPRLVHAVCIQFGSDFALWKDVVSLEEKHSKVLSQTQRVPVVTAGVAVPPVNTSEESKRTDPMETRDPDKASGDGSAGSPTPPNAPENVAADTSIRVHVGLLDNLMNLIGEMVLVRNQVLQYSNQSEDLQFLNLSQRLDLVTSDLQDQVMKTRMQPIGNVLSKFQRLIRDLSKELGKQIDLTIQGKDTELDKTLLEAIKDPLTHIVRNSCDHGIENMAERKAAGKPETGHVLISAFHEGGQVIIEISDDGKGLSRSKLLKKAIEKGLISPDKAEAMTDRDILGLIFLAGFSTAEKVSAVSGRGVGMDVVRTNIEKIGGSVDLESVEGKGTTIRLRIPLTLAIVPAMLIKSSNATYAIPQVKLLELVRVENDGTEESARQIQWLQGKPVYELRGKILPLVDLKKVLSGTAGEELKSVDTMNIVVLSSEAGVFGLIVDEVLDTADIVVKPLSKFLKSLEVYSAATILGTGEVSLIIDPVGIAKAAKLSAGDKKQEGAFVEQEADSKKSSDSQEYLLFKTHGAGKYAVPLCMVSRLEELNHSQIEFTGEQPVIRYRDAILPLFDINKVLGFESKTEAHPEQVPTIVVQRSGKSVGMVVDTILDITTIDTQIDDSIKDRFGVLGNMIYGQEVITVIDVLGIIEKEMGRFLKSTSKPDQALAEATPVRKEKIKVLYAEDVAFFRRQVSKLLTSHGFEVVTAEDGQAALALLNSPTAPPFGLILSDIEMPRMNGYDFIRNARKLDRYKTLPMIALTTRFNQKDIDEGMKAGFDCYLEKLNPDVLLGKLMAFVATDKPPQQEEPKRTVA